MTIARTRECQGKVLQSKILQAVRTDTDDYGDLTSVHSDSSIRILALSRLIPLD